MVVDPHDGMKVMAVHGRAPFAHMGLENMGLENMGLENMGAR
jgi:hypothetical protein